jgi:arylsulfatase A-like enzyme
VLHFFTGRYANRSHTEGAYGPDSPVGMDLEEKTLADVLKSVNYKSMCIGKWHLGYGCKSKNGATCKEAAFPIYITAANAVR